MANVGGLCSTGGVHLGSYARCSQDLPIEMALFMGLGSLPSFIFMPLVPAIKKKVGKKKMRLYLLTVAIVGMAMLYCYLHRWDQCKDQITAGLYRPVDQIYG